VLSLTLLSAILDVKRFLFKHEAAPKSETKGEKNRQDEDEKKWGYFFI
jgi:hypothetical protein